MEPSPISVEASSPPGLAPEIALKSKTAAIEAFESITYGSVSDFVRCDVLRRPVYAD